MVFRKICRCSDGTDPGDLPGMWQVERFAACCRKHREAEAEGLPGHQQQKEHP